MKSPASFDLTAASGPARSAARSGAISCGFVSLALLLVAEVRRPTLPLAVELSHALATATATATAKPGGVVDARALGAAWSFAATLVICAFVRRTLSPRAALYSFAILLTSPLWFVAERVATGSIAPASAMLIMFASLGIATLDAEARPKLRVVAAIAGAAVAAVVCTVPTLKADGLIVIGVPALAIGAAGFADARAKRIAFALSLIGTALLAIMAARFVLHPPAGAAPTFESPVAAFAYGFGPWSLFVPFAIATRPRTAGHFALLIAALLSLAIASFLGAPAIGAPFAALTVAAMLASIDRTRRVPTLLAVGIATLAFLVAHDLSITPSRAITSFVEGPGMGMRPSDADALTKATTSAVLRARIVVLALGAIATTALLLPRRWLPTTRGVILVIAGTLGGLVLRLQAYPSILARLSPSAVLESWHAHRDSTPTSAPLALFDVDDRRMAGDRSDSFVTKANAHEAAAWLIDSSSPHFLAMASAPGDLARVNADYRNAFGRNVPVLVGGDESTFLLSNQAALHEGEASLNPLDRVVIPRSLLPEDLHPLDAALAEHLQAIGWDLVDDDEGKITTISRRNRHARLRVFVRVDAPPSTGFCTFFHVDHSPSRFAAEHKELPYPMELWRPGDIVVDEYDVTLPAAFGKGSYKTYWGFGRLPCQDDKRMPVLSGPSDDHGRVSLGSVDVR